ncbi:2-keto-4-pentenoate hydratase [Staphylococcus sp. SQ8-PEA]|uniref:2-keto-4-pentenoate hydratase n=1 Tax=Staphylococcus marylandisciuri TaxID=2981529 RepID=A0ABT2QRB2_9STAP|nr:2-keto-4-pentenoate hydratase [Staphylococcus marylandisciuri]MCU5746523.1 2-keto-4-pentenoate hydratase [Staphylococcus marylandisciuri]
MSAGNDNVTEKLLHAYRTHQPIPFISQEVSLTEDEAYATQDLLINQLMKDEQSDIAGYKVSMTSEATQSIAQTHEPAYGTLLSHQIHKSESVIKLSQLFSPLIEPEIMFILTADLPSNPTAEDIINHVRIAPGIEVPDARYIDWFPNFTLADLLADNTATGLIVVGEETKPLTYEGFANINLSLVYNDEEIATGSSSEVLGNPIKSLQWLAQKLASHNKRLKKGQIISSGTFISPIPVKKGTYQAKYTDVGTVSVSFE